MNKKPASHEEKKRAKGPTRDAKMQMLMDRVRSTLDGLEGPIQCAELSDVLRDKKWRVWKAISKLRKAGVGIQNAIGGYKMSNKCNQRDDVHFLRRLYGYRTAVQIALDACKPSIESRWVAIKDRDALRSIIAPMVSPAIFKKGLATISATSKSLGV